MLMKFLYIVENWEFNRIKKGRFRKRKFLEILIDMKGSSPTISIISVKKLLKKPLFLY